MQSYIDNIFEAIIIISYPWFQSGIMISYRSGARFNPDEAKYTKGFDPSIEAKISTENVNRGKQKHKKLGNSIKKS